MLLQQFSSRELLDKVKAWEDTEDQKQQQHPAGISPKKKLLAPLNSEGPLQLLNLQIKKLTEENERLKGEVVRTLESAASSDQAAAAAAAATAAAEAARKDDEEEAKKGVGNEDDAAAADNDHEEVCLDWNILLKNIVLNIILCRS